jgi:septum formation protein
MTKYILGSRSPRRKELLALLVPVDSIMVLPPLSAEEKSFDDCRSLTHITERIKEITQDKLDDVNMQAAHQDAIVIVADTTVMAFNELDQPVVLGQPPDTNNWQAVVRAWFEDFYFDKEHQVMTSLLVQGTRGQLIHSIVTTKVRFSSRKRDKLDWYLATGESSGKAGGYGIQGAGSIFLESLEGSLTNVIGLPIEALHSALEELKL